MSIWVRPRALKSSHIPVFPCNPPANPVGSTISVYPKSDSSFPSLPQHTGPSHHYLSSRASCLLRSSHFSCLRPFNAYVRVCDSSDLPFLPRTPQVSHASFSSWSARWLLSQHLGAFTPAIPSGWHSLSSEAPLAVSLSRF